MSTLTVELPDSLKNSIEALALAEGYSVSQFVASAAGEKLAVVLTMDYLRRKASAGRRDTRSRVMIPHERAEVRHRKIEMKAARHLWRCRAS